MTTAPCCPDRITVADGKYTLILEPGALRALRYGEEWRDLCGDGFVMALGHEIQELRAILGALAGASKGSEVMLLPRNGNDPDAGRRIGNLRIRWRGASGIDQADAYARAHRAAVTAGGKFVA